MLPYKMFYDVFCEQIQVKNYLKIKRLNNSNNNIIVEDEYSLSLFNFKDKESVTLSIEAKMKVIGFYVLET